MGDRYDVFLSYSRNDLEAATVLLGQLKKAGLEVFRDQESIRAGELWLNRLQEAVDACGAFVVLVGRDGVRRWIGAETQVALSRHFGPHDDAQRLPIYPILPGDSRSRSPASRRTLTPAMRASKAVKQHRAARCPRHKNVSSSSGASSIRLPALEISGGALSGGVTRFVC